MNADAFDLTDLNLDTLFSKSMTVMTKIRERAVDARSGQKIGPTFPLTRAAQLVGRSTTTIANYEQTGRLPQRKDESGNRLPYDLEDLDRMREICGTRPWRDPSDEPAIISVSNFKGGVGKSTIAQHAAQYFAIKGYRVLLVDCDSQASTTMMFGYLPDIDLTEDDTLYGYFHNTEQGLRSIIRRTHFYGLDLIPANLKLYNLEYEIAGHAAANHTFDIIDTIGDALAEVSDDYDIIIMDPPPALGMISMAVLRAANAMLVPLPPSMVDFASTSSFLDMARTTMAQLEKAGVRPRPGYKWIKLLASRVDENAITHQFKTIMENVYGAAMLDAPIKASSAIGTANAHFKTVYELSQPLTSRKAHNRCIELLDAAFSEIERAIIRSWPSKAESFGEA